MKPAHCPACGSDRVLPILYAGRQEHDAEGRPEYFVGSEPLGNGINQLALWGCESCRLLIYHLLVICPDCGSENIHFLTYGYPSKETLEAANRGEIMLGGCDISRISLREVGCADCRTKFPHPFMGPRH